MKNKSILFLFITVFCSSAIRAEEMTATLSQAPDWTTIRPGDEHAYRLLCDTLRPLLQVEAAELRAELVKYIKLHERDVDALGPLGKIFVLNRMFFNVPEDDKQDDVENFGGWLGVPYGNGRINTLWPVAIDREGRLSIVGHFVGYLGPDYRPLEEFDFFLKKYGKRKVRGPRT